MISPILPPIGSINRRTGKEGSSRRKRCVKLYREISDAETINQKVWIQMPSIERLLSQDLTVTCLPSRLVSDSVA